MRSLQRTTALPFRTKMSWAAESEHKEFNDEEREREAVIIRDKWVRSAAATGLGAAWLTWGDDHLTESTSL